MMGRSRDRAWRQAGFTVAEMMTGLGIFAVVGAAIVSTSVGTFNAVGYQTKAIDTQLDVASAMALLRSDLRAAGYIVDSMSQSVFQQVTTGTTSDSVSFAGDVNADGTSERVTYAVVNGQLLRTQDTWDGSSWTVGTAQPLANNITAFTLKFYWVDPCTTNPPAPTPQPTPAAPTLQTAAQVLAGSTTFVTVSLTGSMTYKGQTFTKTLTSEVAERQLNVRPVCS